VSPGPLASGGATRTLVVGVALAVLAGGCGGAEESPSATSDVTLQIPDVSKFEAATGWRPKRTFEESVRYLLEHWRERIRGSGPR
jgi:nucleoside-diphosphate-sugar epimerase